MAGRAPALSVSREVHEVCLVVVHMGVDGVEHDSCVRTRKRVEPFQQSRRFVHAASQAEIAAEEEDRVEDSKALVDVLQGEQPHVEDASSAADLDRTGRDVDGDCVEPSSLGLQGVTPGACADVEDAPADELERGSLRLDPLIALGEEPLGAHGRPDVTVVALELRLPGASFEVIEEQQPEDVLLAPEDPSYAASDVRRPSSTAIGRIAATTFRM